MRILNLCQFTAALTVTLFASTKLYADSTHSLASVNTIGDRGISVTVSSGRFSVMAGGYSAYGVTDLLAKYEGASESGRGLAPHTDREISGNYDVQTNLSDMPASHPSAGFLRSSSLESYDAYDIWGPDTARKTSWLFARARTRGSSEFSRVNSEQYRHITFYWPGPGTVPRGGSAVTDPPARTTEPNSGLLLVLGFGMIAAAIAAFAKK